MSAQTSAAALDVDSDGVDAAPTATLDPKQRGAAAGPPYTVIYADPPWQYRDRCDAGARGAAHKYRVTRTADLALLDVGAIAAPDALLAMWATWPMLPDALDLIRAWGFNYKTAGWVWVKTTKAGRPSMGMGHYTRANAEMVLLGVRGRIERQSASVRQVVEAPPPDAPAIYAPRAAHSVKPDEVGDRIVELVGDVPRIELFARRRRPGWHAWGDQVPGGSDVDITLRGQAGLAL